MCYVNSVNVKYVPMCTLCCSEEELVAIQTEFTGVDGGSTELVVKTGDDDETGHEQSKEISTKNDGEDAAKDTGTGGKGGKKNRKKKKKAEAEVE